LVCCKTKKETFRRGWEGFFCVSRPVSVLEPRPKTVRGDFRSTNLNWLSELLEPRAQHEVMTSYFFLEVFLVVFFAAFFFAMALVTSFHSQQCKGLQKESQRFFRISCDNFFRRRSAWARRRQGCGHISRAYDRLTEAKGITHDEVEQAAGGADYS
jgi:hypothetical protein